MFIEVLKRMRRLHRLLWVEERVASLEERLRTQADTLRAQDLILQEQARALQEQTGAMQNRVKTLHDQLNRSAGELEALKSDVEVPEELVEEFQTWKTHNPLSEHPLVTVVVATYNRSELLVNRCIPSILNQTYENLEIVVVGDGCTDDTEEAMRGIRDSRLSFVNLDNRQAYPSNPLHFWMVAGTPAINHGLSLARGEYITHLDDDDEYTQDRLQKLVDFAAENSCDFVWHPFWVEEGDDWVLNEATRFSRAQITTSSVLYRSWFKKIPWDIRAYRLSEPGDWNRFRKIKYLDPVKMRYPEPLLKHYREWSQSP